MQHWQHWGGRVADLNLTFYFERGEIATVGEKIRGGKFHNSAARRLENITLRERKQDPGRTTIGETAIDKFDSNRHC